MPSCAVPTCRKSVTAKAKDIGITFHRLPFDEVRRSLWSKILQKARIDPYWKASDQTLICSKHFEEKYVYVTKCGNKKLTKDAIPTKIMFVSTVLQRTSWSPHALQHVETSSLSFNCEPLHDVPITTQSQPPPIQIYSTKMPSNLTLLQKMSPEIPPSVQLSKTLNTSNYKSNEQFTHPTIISSKVVTKALDSADELNKTFLETTNYVEPSVNEAEAPGVNWDNIFDSEFFHDVTENIKNTEFSNELNASERTILKKRNKDIICTDIQQENYDKCGEKRKDACTYYDNLNRTKKQKNERIKLTKHAKQNSDDIAKNIFRKQKYTKTVNNWLNEVDSYNLDNENIVVENVSNIVSYSEVTKTDINIQDMNCNEVSKHKKPKITVNKSVKGTKKVVQAQLANKDGIMKFSKPKTKTVQSDTQITDANVVKNKKEKESNKFVPPIKSQIPVKDVVYEIIIMDDSNIDQYIVKINSVEGPDLFAVLIYSNGFCQLNRHFTDDECIVDGLLFGTGDIFYYFTGINQKIKEALACVLANNTVTSYEAQSVLIYFASKLQMEINEMNMYDVKIGASLLDADHPPENFSDLQKLLSFTAPYTVAIECPLQKACWYTVLLKGCWDKLKCVLEESQLWHVFVDIEMKLLPVISEMECRGVLIDLPKLKCMESILVTRMKEIEQQCYKAAGKVFLINSTVQVRTILYDELKLDSKCNVKIRETLSGGLKSTSEAMLRSLMSVHELPKLLLEYRHLHKGHATFLAGIAQHVQDKVVRPTWVQTAAATGRIASNNPNLQAIPKMPFNLVMFPDADHIDKVQLKFRSLYVSRAGHHLLAADFKHIECRVFAHLAADSALARVLARDGDLFTALAALWLNKGEEAVTPVERGRTKRLVYASLYGAGTRKLMEILDVSYEQALQVAASFNRTFPSLKSFGRQVVDKCSEAGGRLSTLCGRLRHFSNISSPDFHLRSHAERQAVNFVVQGSAADLCKRAMVATEEALQRRRPPARAHLLLQIHDELVWEVARPDVPAAAAIIKRVMEACGEQCGMSAPLPVAIAVGHNWGEMEPYDPPASSLY